MAEVKRVSLQTKEWWVVKNKWGLIVERSHTAAVAYKRPDGTCCFETSDFSQNYEGGGKYGSYIDWDGVSDKYEINCDNTLKQAGRWDSRHSRVIFVSKGTRPRRFSRKSADSFLFCELWTGKIVLPMWAKAP